MRKKEVLSIPNLICYIRLLLIPVFIILYVTADSREDYYLAAGVILFCGFTDFLDGFIARKFKMITEFGKMIDPIADKFLQAAVIIALMSRYRTPIFIMFGLFAVKEIFMAVNGIILMRRGKKLNGAKWYGKVSTAVFYISMFVLIAIPYIPENIFKALIFISTFCLALSFIMYIPVYIKMYREVKENI